MGSRPIRCTCDDAPAPDTLDATGHCPVCGGIALEPSVAFYSNDRWPWIEIRGGTTPAMRCKVCNAEQPLDKPRPEPEALRLIAGFFAIHKRCT